MFPRKKKVVAAHPHFFTGPNSSRSPYIFFNFKEVKKKRKIVYERIILTDTNRNFLQDRFVPLF